MWKPSKAVLFFLVLINATLGGVAFSFVDWQLVRSGQGVFKELELPVLFLLLSIFFVFSYVKKLKGDK